MRWCTFPGCQKNCAAYRCCPCRAKKLTITTTFHELRTSAFRPNRSSPRLDAQTQRMSSSTSTLRQNPTNSQQNRAWNLPSEGRPRDWCWLVLHASCGRLRSCAGSLRHRRPRHPTRIEVTRRIVVILHLLSGPDGFKRPAPLSSALSPPSLHHHQCRRCCLVGSRLVRVLVPL